MDKKLPNDKILELIKAMQSGQLDDKNLPPHIREMLQRAQATGAQVLALSEEQFRALGPEIGNLLDDGLSLAVSQHRDLTDPRYKLPNDFAKELIAREFELMRLSTDGAPGHVAIRLLALHYGNVNEIMKVAKRKAAESGDMNSERPVLATLAMMQTLGLTNVFDAIAAGKDRLRWHGVQAKAFDYIHQFADNIAFVVSKHCKIPLPAVKIITSEMEKVKPLDPLPPEKVFNGDLRSDFMRSILPEANFALDELIAGGYDTMEKILSTTAGLKQLAEDAGISAEGLEAFSDILERLDSVSVEAMDAVYAMLPEDDDAEAFEAERQRQALLQPVITLDNPVVLAGLGQNLVTTLEIAGVVDLHEVTGLRPSEAGTMIRGDLTEGALRDIKNVARFLNQDCDCESCRHFKQQYVEMNPAIKFALRTPPQKPTLH